MRRTSAILVSFAAVVGCDRPEAALICHNANCAEPADPARDDTVEALRESLALERDGVPVIDGLELDTFWRRADQSCLFAHDLDRDQTPALEPATEIATYFGRGGPIGHGDVPFRVIVELKSHVSADTTDLHDADDLVAHAACVWQIYDVLATAAVANRRDVIVTFEAFRPALLQAVIDQTPTSTPLPIDYAAIQGVPAPLDDQTRPLDDYAGLPITIVEFHAQWILDAQYEAVRSLGADLAVFMFSATAETFAVIEQYEPKLVVTSEATLVRRWLDR
jgi:hypothetical protein